MTVAFGGLTALESVSLSLASGEVVGVIGPNGAGKTT
ncbi:MAG TPA: ATP-binding cassette domain-containing protein, partial [Acidimicrobiia bacterium]|nr:ATP-binding cassette domain-containing protein [Acidimicrobiia bacterium]